MSEILHALLRTLPDGEIATVLIGLHWTAVVAHVNGQEQCGLASTLQTAHEHRSEPDIPQAGELARWPAARLAALALSDHPTQAAVGVAAVNALLPRPPRPWQDLNAEEVIAKDGAGRSVAIIGHFPFVERLRPRVGRLHVLEQNPQPGDLPASAAPEVLPHAGVIAITGTALINHTLADLLALCSPQAKVILLGPSSPLSPICFAYGIDIICGAIVTAVSPVLETIAQGGNFRQLHRAGVRTVTMTK